MSAFMVGTTHIDALLTAGLAWHTDGRGRMHWHHGNPSRFSELTFNNAGQVGAMLLAANQRSVNHRYTEDEIETPYVFTLLHGQPDPVVVLKAVNCFEYQSCEHPEWGESEAHAFCMSLQAAAIHRLPGYDKAPWGIDSTAVFLR